MSQILAVIPARYASTRFPGKPLVDIQGKPMIQRVYEQCKKADSLAEVMVATDDARIFSAVEGFGGKVMMTAADHANGTDRIAEVAANHPQYEYCVNIQGDEPFIEPEQINLLCNSLTQPGVDIATLVKEEKDWDVLQRASSVKVVLDREQYALYFSRFPIPFCRNEADQRQWTQHQPYYKHLGIYGFRREVLLAVPHLSPAPLEIAESLEQLRWLYHGYRIKTAITTLGALSIDTPEDLARISPQNRS
jgi:3-deoxy-manno-octulosonate cytidylyltransferase (CMP-KDO synthetase)